MSYKVALIQLGHTQHLVDFQSLRKWKSKLFSVTSLSRIDYMPESDVNDGYLDVKYSRDQLQSIVSCPSNCDFAVAIMPYRLTDNFYMHRINDKCIVISLHGIAEILSQDNISVEHFIIKQIYEISALFHLMLAQNSDDPYGFLHIDTRGCLLDYNGERTDILYNTEQPILCEECKAKFKRGQVDQDFIINLEKELKRIRKPLVLCVEKWIKNYPLLAVFISVFTTIILNIIATIICNILFEK